MQKLLVPYSAKGFTDSIKSLIGTRDFELTMLSEISPSDIDTGLTCIDNDVCVTSIAQIGQFINYIQHHPDEEVALLACELCLNCRSANIASLSRSALSNAGIPAPQIITLSAETISNELASQNPRDTKLMNSKNPLIGLISNYPLLANSYFLEETREHLEKSGCQVVTPPIQLIAGQQSYLEKSLQYFRQSNVKSVVCIVAFGCLGGHVYSRGVLRKLQKSYPEIAINILDYDYSASSINLINRLELVVQSMTEQ